jgi:hypothetical protein
MEDEGEKHGHKEAQKAQIPGGHLFLFCVLCAFSWPVSADETGIAGGCCPHLFRFEGPDAMLFAFSDVMKWGA